MYLTLLDEGILVAGGSAFIFPLAAESWKLPYVFNSSLAADLAIVGWIFYSTGRITPWQPLVLLYFNSFSFAGESWLLAAVSLVLTGRLYLDFFSLAGQSWQLVAESLTHFEEGILPVGNCIYNSSSLALESWQLAAVSLILVLWHWSWQLAAASTIFFFRKLNLGSWQMYL